MDAKFRLGSTLRYNKEKEGDMVRQLESLRDRHKLGGFITNLLRIAFENPAELRELGLRVEDYGISDNRKKFFDGIEKDIKEMSEKVDKVYDMAVKTYSLAMFNKKMGMEQKSTNILQAQFVLQKQISELCSVLGISTLGHTFEANKVYNVAKNVDETLEFIINYYDGIVGEIKQNIDMTYNNQSTGNNSSSVVASDGDSVDGDELSTVDGLEDEVIDFGSSADLDLLSKFINE